MEKLGETSRCLNIYHDNKKKAGCYVIECEGNRLKIEVGKEIKYCYKDTIALKFTVNKENVEVTCPDVQEFCEIERERSMCKD